MEPSVFRIFQERGIVIRTLSRYVKVFRAQEHMDFDILGVNKEYAIPIAVEDTVGIRVVNQYIERLKKFKILFPEYADRKTIGAIAGIVIHMDVDKYAYKKGLFVIAQSGNAVKILNDMAFKPKEW
ncbi:MAG: hypothetical protein C4527_28150 [Candidatus Omnitrophota bacterium]|nr:MAG: hypothetical protein C4527_28150 [Candidatus Omnitrophota bacterium]